ncbi:MAG: uroporphyrinogen-III synthase [Candidatus Bathyarchaeota archaeon]|nr:uroporphyrinogen-III synthase [Candidatus Bathyarchaeota archaeon]
MVQDQLKGKTIAITRPCGQAEEEAEMVRRKGGTPYFFPTIEIKAPTDLAPVKSFIESLSVGKADYVIFMSVNGVTNLLDAAQRLNQLTSLEEGLRRAVVIAVGPRTAQELQTNKIRVDLVPSRYTSEGVLNVLKQREIKCKRVFIPRTPAASPALMEKLRELGALVDEVYVYESAIPVDTAGVNEKFLRDLTDGRIDAIVFGSSLCVKNLFKMLGAYSSTASIAAALNRVVVVAIGPVTAKTLAELEVRVGVVPEEHLFLEAIDALANCWHP